MTEVQANIFINKLMESIREEMSYDPRKQVSYALFEKMVIKTVKKIFEGEI